VTIAKRPSIGRETGELLELICPTPQGKGLRHFNTTGKSLAVCGSADRRREIRRTANDDIDRVKEGSMGA
jgi:hypothetical protein